MKSLYIYLITILLSFSSGSCLTETDNPVTGNWSFLIANGYNCYTCPRIEFGNDGTGNLVMSSTNKIEFSYKLLSDNKIEFDFNKDKKQSLFKQSEVFYYEIHSADGFSYIDLLDVTDKEIIHTLVAPISKTSN